MKNPFRELRPSWPVPALVALALGGLSACASAQPPAAMTSPASCLSASPAPTIVKVKVDGGLPEFEDEAVCAVDPLPGSPSPGRVCVDINKRPDLRFVLNGPDATKWKFRGIQLSADGVSWGGALPLGAYSDFDFASDAALLAGTPHATITGNTMHVKNNNCHEFTVHYRVILENDKGEVIRLHPIIVNRGTEPH